MDQGIVLTGGGALLQGLDSRLHHETAMPSGGRTRSSVVLGTGKCLEEFEALKRVLITTSTRAD